VVFAHRFLQIIKCSLICYASNDLFVSYPQYKYKHESRHSYWHHLALLLVDFSHSNIFPV